MPGVLIVVLLLGAATLLGVLLQRRDGRFRPAGRPPRSTQPELGQPELGEPEPGQPAPTQPPLDPVLASLGVTPGTPLTLLQFSSAFCAPCRATRVLCADAVTRHAGVRHLEIDAEAHLDAVRALDIWRTPTVLLVDAAGTVVQRASGAPTRAQLDAAVVAALSGGHES